MFSAKAKQVHAGVSVPPAFWSQKRIGLLASLHDFSEMAAVRVIYPEKVERYVRYQGKHQFGPGGLSHDVTHAAAVYGLFHNPFMEGARKPVRTITVRWTRCLEGMAKEMVEQSGRIAPAVDLTRLKRRWMRYLGACPNRSNTRQKSYALDIRDAMGIDPEAYVTLTSFTHHPFGQSFILEVPDNHAQGLFWNVPLDDLETIGSARAWKGFTVAWDADVSNKGFSFSNGWAIMPETAEDCGRVGDARCHARGAHVDQAMRQRLLIPRTTPTIT